MNLPWKLRHIVAATDFSAASIAAVERAALLARTYGARLVVAHVIPASLFEDVAAQLADTAGIALPSREALRDEALAHLARRAAEIERAHSIKCEAEATVGRPGPELARLAGAASADLLVVAARGEHSALDLLLGTTTQKLLRVSPCPILVVKRAPQFDYRTVLAPTDFSPASEAALQGIGTLLQDAALHVAHAFELPFDGLARFAGVDRAAMARYQVAEADRLRLELAAFVDRAGIPAHRRVLHVAHGYAATCIERWIVGTRADLVAIAAHGKSEIERTFLGSVSLHTVMSAPCDVLVLRGEEFA